jgi:hypothetical protein
MVARHRREARSAERVRVERSLRSDAVRRHAKARALRKNGIHIYRLPLRDICV